MLYKCFGPGAEGISQILSLYLKALQFRLLELCAGFRTAFCKMMIPHSSPAFGGLLHQLSLVLALNFEPFREHGIQTEYFTIFHQRRHTHTYLYLCCSFPHTGYPQPTSQCFHFFFFATKWASSTSPKLCKIRMLGTCTMWWSAEFSVRPESEKSKQAPMKSSAQLLALPSFHNSCQEMSFWLIDA